MTKPSIPLGLVFSRSGPYAMMAGEMRKSALMAVDEINQSNEFDFTFTPHLRDPGGVVAGYHTACAELIREDHVDHIIGCARTFSPCTHSRTEIFCLSVASLVNAKPAPFLCSRCE